MGCLVMPEPPLQAQAQLPVATTGRDPPSLPQVLSPNPLLVTELLVFWLSPLMLPKPRDRERPKPFPLLQQPERPSSTRRSTTRMMTGTMTARASTAKAFPGLQILISTQRNLKKEARFLQSVLGLSIDCFACCMISSKVCCLAYINLHVSALMK